MSSAEGSIFQLEQDEELRIEVDCPKNEVVTVELRTGMAEIFGTEMVPNNQYRFHTGAKIAIFTFQGCTIVVRGKMDIQPYTSKETPMIMYLNAHAALEDMRKAAENDTANQKENGNRGPVVMVVGPSDVGKSTLCRLLANYAVRMGRRPISVDLDVGQGAISVPGSIGAILIERPASIEEGFSQNAPLVYHYGHKTPGHNSPLYNRLVSRMADVVRERLSANKKSEASGVIINTCGWVRGEGYNQIKHTAQAFEVDVIIVLDQERVYNDLVRDMPSFVKVIWLPKSGGVVERSTEQRQIARDQRVKQYFYGPTGNLFPHSFEVRFSELKEKIYKIGAPALPDSCMPLGMKSEDNQTKLVAVQLTTRDLLNHVVSVSFASATEDLIMTNIAGFICITDVNMDEQKVTILSPQPRPLPDTLLLLSDIQYVDSS
ncbi:protein CLP1 homolog [Tigriopus californicus]|uniref:protein CLP1 homolog n=1 Tax=Tigriopus californicus TaxID=6832 RepID=UPI0027DA44BA|nr:protein CLP1 homolog [Tigriopus californicus]